MKRRLFSRYFYHRDSIIPENSEAITSFKDVLEFDEIVNVIANESSNVAEWITRHPEGRVDFVWL